MIPDKGLIADCLATAGPGLGSCLAAEVRARSPAQFDNLKALHSRPGGIGLQSFYWSSFI